MKRLLIPLLAASLPTAEVNWFGKYGSFRENEACELGNKERESEGIQL